MRYVSIVWEGGYFGRFFTFQENVCFVMLLLFLSVLLLLLLLCFALVKFVCLFACLITFYLFCLFECLASICRLGIRLSEEEQV